MFFWAAIEDRYHGIDDDFFSQGTRNEMCICFFMAGCEWRAPQAISSCNAATSLRSQDRAGSGGGDHARPHLTGECTGHHHDH
jgi:hypothetical protein